MKTNLKTKFVNLFNSNTLVKSACIALVLILSATNVYAADPVGMDKLDSVIDVVATWLGRIGLIVAFFGAVQLALGFKNDDADGKVRGMKTLASGFLVFGITQSLSLFGL
ncbi:hypothetical protein [Paenibacillus tuaregi]|uniref:hypothetical protein n=1 Tax=Paenibacillus tuaregi TaxID=1816681 RepID=UPI000B076344|nr:hypothetical protein [Paenibacillus tuaregi]